MKIIFIKYAKKYKHTNLVISLVKQVFAKLTF